jgi:hypothetical protein
MSEMVSGEFTALLRIVTLPTTLPAAAGANCTVKLVLWLAARVSGTARPVNVKPEPEALACVIVTEVFPEF